MARFMLSLPDTAAADYIDATQAVERLKDGYAAFFQKFDALLTPVLPIPSFKHKQAELLIDGQTVTVMGIMSATTPLSVTGLPGVSMRFGTSHDGMPIGVQIVGSWQTESTILHIASLLEQVSPVRDLHPNL
jgi:aspartyl-tRNA(Asn)/glutamyl-tRNA(Gln) amidotransferase subunit A